MSTTTHLNGRCVRIGEAAYLELMRCMRVEAAPHNLDVVHGPADATDDDYASFRYYARRAADLRLSHAHELAHAADVIQRRLAGEVA